MNTHPITVNDKRYGSERQASLDIYENTLWT